MDPVHIPASHEAGYPVAFSRRWLEKWHRRSGGRCPMTGAALDLKERSCGECPAECRLSAYCIQYFLLDVSTNANRYTFFFREVMNSILQSCSSFVRRCNDQRYRSISHLRSVSHHTGKHPKTASPSQTIDRFSMMQTVHLTLHSVPNDFLFACPLRMDIDRVPPFLLGRKPPMPVK